MTALSAVGAACSAGAVCACTPELNVKAPTSAATAIIDLAIGDPFSRPIIISIFFDTPDPVAGSLQRAIIAEKCQV
jgi:hypothetical protein